MFFRTSTQILQKSSECNKTIVFARFYTLGTQHAKAKKHGLVAQGPVLTELLAEMVLKTALGARRPRFWKCRVRSWGSLGPLVGALGLPWASLGRSWAALGRDLGAAWALLAASWLPNAAQDGLHLDFSPILARFCPSFKKVEPQW